MKMKINRMNFDTLEEIEGTLIHHGPVNNRVYFMDFKYNNFDKIITNVNRLANKKKYDKIIGKVPESGLQQFLVKGFKVEAKIPNLFKDATGYFISEYLNKKREYCSLNTVKIIESVKKIALAAALDNQNKSLPLAYDLRKLESKDLERLSDLNKLSFKTYAFPICEIEYLKECLQNNYEFYGAYKDSKLVISAMVKIDKKESNAEVIDFAIHPNYRGQNLSFYVMNKIKEAIIEKGLNTLYAMVRSTSYGLNITFAKQGFIPGGTLINNTLVENSLENMNVWYLNLNK